MRAVELLRCIFGVSPDQIEPGRQTEDCLHHAVWSLLLPDYDVRLEECRHHLSALHAEVSPQATRQNAHVYVDDVVVKTEKRGTLLEDLQETFENLRRFQIKLNPEKCVFGVPAGQLLGFLVSERGIECNPVKIKAIERMEVPN